MNYEKLNGKNSHDHVKSTEMNVRKRFEVEGMNIQSGEQVEQVAGEVFSLLHNTRELASWFEESHYDDWMEVEEISNTVELIEWWVENWMEVSQDMSPVDVDWYGYQLRNARNALEKLEEITNLEEVSELLEVA